MNRIQTVFTFSMLLILSACTTNTVQPGTANTDQLNANQQGENSLFRGTAEKIIIEDNDRHEGYDELSNEDSLDYFTISEYNTDLDHIPNIERPDRSTIINPVTDPQKLFGIWVENPGPQTPHATFQLTQESFYVVDYDGNGDMPYEIRGDSITVYYNDFIKKGRIIESPKADQLTIHWANSKRPSVYHTWKY